MPRVKVGTITSKGRITIPKEIRDSLALREGDGVIFVMEDGHVTIRKAAREKLSLILRRQITWKKQSLKFQKMMREEWQE